MGGPIVNFEGIREAAVTGKVLLIAGDRVKNNCTTNRHFYYNICCMQLKKRALTKNILIDYLKL